MTRASTYTKQWRERYIAKHGIEEYRKMRNAEQRRHTARHPELLTWKRNYARKYTQKLREECWAAYGNKCSCCGETRSAFFTIDHIANDGSTHRKTINSGHQFHLWLRKRNWPKDNFRLLCYNCNCGRQNNGGICPHELEKE